MALLPLVIYPDDILVRPSAVVDEITQDTVDFIANMRETMYASHGIGLAAPQVAKNVRIMTVDVDAEHGGRGFMHIINPTIVEGHGKALWDEGCLSFPGLVIEVRRKKTVHLRGYDLHGRPIDLEAGGLFAICLQHELDHLNGVTFVDRLSPVQKTLVVRDYLRQREDDEEDRQIEDILRVHGVRSEREAAEAGDAVLKAGVQATDL